MEMHAPASGGKKLEECWERRARWLTVTVSQNLYDSVTVFDSGREFDSGPVLFRVGHAVMTTVFGNAVVYYCARKNSSFTASGDAGFSVLTPVVTEAHILKKVLFKGDWSQSR